MIKSEQSIAGSFPVTSAPDGSITATLIINGVDDSSSVTITNTDLNYKWSVTLPVLSAGDIVQIRASGTWSSVDESSIVWSDVADLKYTSDSLIVGTNSDKTGYSISGVKTTLDDLNDIDGSSVTVTTNSDKTGYSISGTKQTLDVLNDFDPSSDTVSNANTSSIGGSAAAATKLSSSAGLMVIGTVDDSSFSPTTTEFEAADITAITNGHFTGRLVGFTSGTLQYEMKDITDYSLVSGKGHFTVSGLTFAPSNGDTFVII